MQVINSENVGLPEGMYINTAIDTCASDEANKRTAMMVEILMMRRMSCCD